MSDDEDFPFKALIENAPDAITLIDSKTAKFEIVNENACELFKLDRLELLTKTPIDVSPKYQPDGRLSSEAGLDYISQANNDEKPVFKWVHLNSEGEEIICEIRLTKVMINGKPMVRGSILDITEREKSKQLIKEQERRYQKLVESSPLGIGIIQNHKIKMVNSAFIRMLNYPSKNEIVGKTLSDIIAPQYQDMIFGLHSDRMKGEGRANQHQIEIIKFNGESIWVNSNVTSITYEDSPAALVFLENIDEQMKHVQEYELMQDQLRKSQKMESLGIIASGIAHDFNNFLVGILGKADILQQYSDLSPQQQGYVEDIVSYSEQAKDLINQILVFGGESTEITQEFDLDNLIEELKSIVDTSVKDPIQVKYDLNSDKPIIANKDQVRQIIMNLIVNANDAISKNGVITIRTKEEKLDEIDLLHLTYSINLQPGPYICLEVEDTGSGIDPGEIDQIFDLFYSSKDHKRGLGLATVLGSVKTHKGGIKVQSEKGKGTTFSIYFRPSTKPLDQLEEAPKIVANKPLRRVQNGKTVLVCDDKDFVLDTLSMMLEIIGMKTEIAHSGPAAIEKIKKHEYDMVILDLSMPEMDGIETLKRIRKFNFDTPIIISTGYEIRGIKDDVMDIPKTGFLKKPYGIETLREILDEFL